MTMKYREAFRKALDQKRLTASCVIGLPHTLYSASDKEAEGYVRRRRDVAFLSLAHSLGVEVAKRAEVSEEDAPYDFTHRLSATVFVFSPEELERLIQATAERARADLNWRRNRAPSFPSEG